jgi:hypothetical protein
VRLIGTVFRLVSSLFWISQQGRQHFLQAGNEYIGLARAFSHFFDLIIFHVHLVAQKIDVALPKQSLLAIVPVVTSVGPAVPVV